MENNKMERLAKDIYKWCVKKDLWGDNILYFNTGGYNIYLTQDELAKMQDTNEMRYENNRYLAKQ